MNAFWSYFLPALGAGLVIGVIAGLAAVRARIVRVRERPHDPDLIRQPRRRRMVFLSGGLVASIIAAALWHGPLGAADRFAAEVQRIARQVLVDNEAPSGMTARIHRGPITRELMLSGPGNDFQQSEAVRLLNQISGVSDARWRPSAGIPLIAEGAIAALLGFLLGVLVAYLVELRRRHNSQWNW